MLLDAGSYVTFLNNPLLAPRQWPSMTIASAVSYGLNYLLSFYLSADANSAVSSFAVGMVGGIYSRIWKHPPLITVISGILMLVPGSIGVRGVSAFLQNDIISGLQ